MVKTLMWRVEVLPGRLSLYRDGPEQRDLWSTTEDAEIVQQITEQIIGAAISVHRELGPGLLESAYHACMAWELRRRGLPFERQKIMPVVYRGTRIDCGYRIDLFVSDSVVVELKAVDRLDPIHTAQMLTYLKLARCRIGLLINFNVPVLKDGIRRLVLG